MENYSVITFLRLLSNSATDVLEEIKIGYIDCYAGKKDPNGQNIATKGLSSLSILGKTLRKPPQK